MEKVIKEVYQSNSGTAYEVYKETIKKIAVFGFKM